MPDIRFLFFAKENTLIIIDSYLFNLVLHIYTPVIILMLCYVNYPWT